MKKIIKWLVSLVSIIIVLIVLALIFLPKLIDLTAVANEFADKAETEIGRQISIDDVSFSIFSGIHIKGIVLANDKSYSRKPMLKISELVLAYKLWPLIKERKVAVENVGIKGLDLLLELKGKTNNIASLSKSKPKPKPVKEKVAMKDMKVLDVKIDSPIDINVKKIFIYDSNVTIINHNNESKVFKIEDIDFAITNLSTDLKYSPAKIKSSIRLVGENTATNIDFNGKLKDYTAADLELKIDKVVVDKLIAAFVKEDTAKKKTKKTKKDKSTESVEDKPLDVDFTFLKNIDLDFVFTLKQFQFNKLKVSGVKAKVALHKLALTFETAAKLYEGSVDMNLDAKLANPRPEFHTTLSINKVVGEEFLKNGLDINDFVEGKLSADGDFKGELRWPKKLTGHANVTFSDGKYVSGKILGETVQPMLESIEGKGFNEFFIELKLKSGKADIGAFKITGDDFALEHTLNLNVNVNKIVNKELDKQKAALEAQKKAAEEKVQAELAAKQAEIEAQKKAAEEEAKKAVEEEAAKALQGLGL